MWVLEKPHDEVIEDENLTSILDSANHFKGHDVVWKKAYADYRAAKGDPWQVGPSVFEPDIKAKQIELYDNRRSGGPIKRIRETEEIRCCPVCGSPSIGTLDHYLPKDEYPEFSVLASNLVPACSLCNSGAKGRIFKGEASPERFIHPYYDRWAASPMWQVKVIPSYAAATFEPAPHPKLTGAAKTIVEFHLSHVFGVQFYVQMATYWHDLPKTLAKHPELRSDPKKAWVEQLRWSADTLGLNGWRSALIRGTYADEAARSYIETQARELPQTDEPRSDEDLF